MHEDLKKPVELGKMFSSNLKELSKAYPSISELTRQIGINRTQFNRYLSGESFPRPDILAKMCMFFNVDARVLLEPVEQIENQPISTSDTFLTGFFRSGVPPLAEETFPSGFYKFSRRSFIEPEQFIVGLVYVKRQGSNTYIRGYETKAAMKAQSLPLTSKAREFRGSILQQEDGIVAHVSRRNTLTTSFNYLHKVSSFENNFWVGYVTRTIPETPTGLRATRLVYEHLGRNFAVARNIAASTGYRTIEGLDPFHKRLLQPEVPFR